MWFPHWKKKKNLHTSSGSLLKCETKVIYALGFPHSDIRSASTHTQTKQTLTNMYPHIYSSACSLEYAEDLSEHASLAQWMPLMSRGHIIIYLVRTLTVDTLIVAWSWFSTTYNITVDDVHRSVLKPCTSHTLVKIVGMDFIKYIWNIKKALQKKKFYKCYMYTLYQQV